MPGISSFINQFHLCRQIPIFSKLRWFEITKIARKSIVIEYKKGETIRRQGDQADFLYCLVSGRLQAFREKMPGYKENIDYIHRGMHFGIISLLTGEPHSLTYEAINDSVILKVPKDDFEMILKAIPQLGVELSHSLSKRIRKNVQGIKSVFESTIISIYSPVKGTGSSTYAFNLALTLEKETKKKVVFLNIHGVANQKSPEQPQAVEDADFVGINLKEVLNDFKKVFSSIKKGLFDVDLLTVFFDPSDQSFKKQISPLVSALVGDYHYVIVDLPNDMDDFVIETLTQSDEVHLISMDEPQDLQLIRNVISQLEVTFKDKFRAEKVQVIIRSLHHQTYLSYDEINRAINFNVFTVLPPVEATDLKENIYSRALKIPIVYEHTEYGKSVRRIARQIGGVMVGLVLGGGAALGIAHVGVIRVLEQENIPIDIIVGSSMGALIGSLWAIGNDAKNLEKIAREFEKKSNILKLFDPVVPIKGLVGGRAIRHWLINHLAEKTFYNTKIPFKVVAYDLIRREEIVIDSGSLVEAVRRSIAIPGVIEPIHINSQLIIDGGVLNPLPTNVLSSRGIKRIIAVNVLQSPEHVSLGYDMLQQEMDRKEKIQFLKSPFQYLGFRMYKVFLKFFGNNISDIIVRTLQATEYVLAEQSAQQADVVIHPNLVGVNWYELHRVDELIKAGEDATRLHLEEIKKLVEHSS